MGLNKSFLTLDGEPFIAVIIKTLLTVMDELVVSIGPHDNVSAYSRILPASVKIVRDEVEGQSPVIGIITGLSKTKAEYATVLPCDAPFTKARVIEHLFNKAEGFDAAIPQWPGGGTEPLHAVYLVSTTLDAARKAVAAGGLKCTDIIGRLTRINYVAIEEIRPFDPQLMCFFNVNTPQQLMMARRIAEDPHCRKYKWSGRKTSGAI
jgi:molybdopterin-guanine dinucleotide biosynthesis protein A